MLRAAFRDKLKASKDDSAAHVSSNYGRENDETEKLEPADKQRGSFPSMALFVKQTNGNEEQEHIHVDFHDSSYESAHSDTSGREEDNSKGTSGKGHDASIFPERAIYEMQLVQLQEQLVAAMIASEDASAELNNFKKHNNVENLKKELEREREDNRVLREKLKQKQKATSSKLQRKPASRGDPRNSTRHPSPDVDWVHVGQDFDDLSQIPSASRNPDWTAEPANNAAESTIEAHITQCEVPQSCAQETGLGANQKKSKFIVFKERLVALALDRLWDFVSDSPESDDPETVEEELAVKTLKENIQRFTNAIRPITNFIKAIRRLMSWKSPTATFLVLVVYMYAVWHGILLPLLLLLVIWKLFMNYLYTQGILKQLGFPERASSEEPVNSEEYSWSDKFHLVLQVARKVQNTLGRLADSLEKMKNLLTWQHQSAARLLFVRLCLIFVASLVLNGPRLFMIVGLFFGFKLFITDPLYKRFPKVKKRYDGMARIWIELPTDAELAAQEQFEMALTRCNTGSSSAANGAHAGTEASCGASEFSEKFNLPPAETPLPDWEEGRRCCLMDKDRPLSHIKHGRLYLSQSHLCFEKIRGKNIVIKLEDIKSLTKAKPIGLMPGTGMALEVRVRALEKPYIFGAILARDEVYEFIRAAGRAANLPWASGQASST